MSDFCYHLNENRTAMKEDIKQHPFEDGLQFAGRMKRKADAEIKRLELKSEILKQTTIALTTENRALRAAFSSLRDRLTEVAVQAEDAVIAINMDSASGSQRMCWHAEHTKHEPGPCPKCGETYKIIGGERVADEQGLSND